MGDYILKKGEGQEQFLERFQGECRGLVNISALTEAKCNSWP